MGCNEGRDEGRDEGWEEGLGVGVKVGDPGTGEGAAEGGMLFFEVGLKERKGGKRRKRKIGIVEEWTDKG